MKRLLVFLSLIVLLSIPTFAQSSMSDRQVFEYIMKQHENGMSQSEIAADLIKKGVDANQLKRVRAKYEKEYRAMSGNSTSQISNTGDRGRIANGEQKTKKDNSADAVVSDLISEQPEYQAPKDKKSQAMIDELVFEGEEEEEIKIFGHDIFRKEDLSFEPNMNIATPEDYILGPGDAVFIDIYGASQQTINGVISPDGFVTIEEFGPINLSGLTVKQANARLRSQLGSRFESSNIKLSLGQTRTIRVNVMGEVETPGTYTLSAFSSVFHALYMAGGVNDIGTLRDIKVYRKNKLVTSVDIYDYILNGQLSGNIQLVDDDVIIIGAYDCLVNVEGKIKRPMYYEMKKTETMKQLLEYAGGFTGDAYTKSVRALRKSGRDMTVFSVEESDYGTFNLADRDVVQVDSIIQRYSNAVEVMGAVFRPGLYQVGEKIRTVKNLIDYAEGVTEDAFLAHAVLHRMKLDRTLEIVSVDLEGILNGTASDIYLRNEDVLLVPSLKDSKIGQTLTIHGEVYYPGIYKYAANATVEDLILKAGGLKETASSIKIDVARRIKDPKATKDSEMRAMTYSFELRDGFIVDADPSFTLQPYDEVYVRRSPGYSEQENVEVTGEVLFAGNYTLSKQNYRLSDLITAAGGPSSMANVSGARLQRKTTDEEKLRMQQSLKMAQDKAGNKDSLNISDFEVAATYFVGIDLEKALKNPGGDEDVVLHEGDKLIVPRLINTVKINGEVMYPNTVSYISGKNARYYISQAGGYSNQAKKSRGYIIYQNGKVSKLRRGTKVAPGSEIVIPAKPQKDASALTTQWISISTSLATIAALVISVIK